MLIEYESTKQQHELSMILQHNKELQRVHKEGWLNIHRIKKEIGLHKLGQYNAHDLFIVNIELHIYFKEKIKPTKQPKQPPRFTCPKPNTSFVDSYNYLKFKQKEQIMTIKKITTRTFYGEINLDEQSTNSIFEYIRGLKKTINSLETVAEESKAAANQIETCKNNIKALATYIDKREK